MATCDVGIRSIAVKFPSRLRTNQYYIKRFPEIVAAAEEKALARAFMPVKADLDAAEVAWIDAMQQYAKDPFRGTVERRVMGPGETTLTLEEGACREALDKLCMQPQEVDCLIEAAMFQEHPGPPNAAFLAEHLGLRGAGWSVGAQCGASVVALEQACALVRAGLYRNVLIAVSCGYSRLFDEDDTLGWTGGDAAAAIVVGPLQSGTSVLSTTVKSAVDTCGLFYQELTDRASSCHGVVRASKRAGAQIAHLFARYARVCCDEVLAKAGVGLDQVKLIVCYPATAWYSAFMAKVLEVDTERVVNLYPAYGNISVASAPVHLYHAALEGRVRSGDLVLLYTHGFSGACAAVLMRWGDVALGAPPPPSSSLLLDEPHAPDAPR